METAVFLPAAWLDSLGGGILRDAVGAVRHCVCSGKSRRQGAVLSDFQRGCFADDWEFVLWQRAAEKIKYPLWCANTAGDKRNNTHNQDTRKRGKNQ